MYKLNNCLRVAPITPNDMAKIIANEPYNRGLLSAKLIINFEKKFKFSMSTISAFSIFLSPSKKNVS